MKKYLKIIACYFFLISNVNAESELNLAKTVQNPLAINSEARHFTLPFVNYTNFDYGTARQTQNILDLKPVTPFPFTDSFDLILRTIIPLSHQPRSHGYINGLGDVNPTAFIAPALNSWLIWGAGPTFVIPTATNKALGAGKWSLGPEIVLIAMPSQWTFAILTNNIWSIAGSKDRASVNEMSFQYFITYNFSQGWYITTQPNSTANWMQKSGEVWTVPQGGGVGRAFRIGTQALNFSIQGYYNVVRPTAAARWTLQATFEFLFDDHRFS